jgi:hypothetical protein
VTSGSKAAQKLVVEAHATSSHELLDVAMAAAILSRKPAEVYDIFAPHYLAETDGQKKGRGPAAKMRECLQRLFMQWSGAILSCDPAGFDLGLGDSWEKLKGAKMDPRWLDAAVETKDFVVVLALARPGHKGACDMLAEELGARLKKRSDWESDSSEILETMVRIGHPKMVEYFVEAIGHAGETKTADNYWIGPLIEQLPVEAAPLIEALLPSLPENLTTWIVPWLAALQAKAAQASNSPSQ